MCVMPSKSTFDTNYVAQKYEYNDFTSFLKRSVLKLEQRLRHLLYGWHPCGFTPKVIGANKYPHQSC